MAVLGGGGGLQAGGAAGAAAEVTLEVPHKVAPHAPFDAQSLKDRAEWFGDLAALVATPLAAGPVQQRQVVRKRHRQKALVAGPDARATGLRAGGLALVKCQWSKPPVAGDALMGVGGAAFAGLAGGGFLAALCGSCGLDLGGGFAEGNGNKFAGGGLELLPLEGLDAVVGRGVLALLGGCRHRRPDRVQVDVHGAGQQARFVGDSLGFEAAFPEAAGAVVLLVGHAGDRLAGTSHEPRDVAESRADQFQAVFVTLERLDVVFGGLAKVFFEAAAGEKLEPALGDLPVGPRGDDVGAVAEDQVHVVGEDGIGQDVDAEYGCENLEPASYPFASRLEVPAAGGVFSGQIGLPHAALDGVDDTDFPGIKYLTSRGPWHGKSPEKGWNSEYNGSAGKHQ